MYTSSFGITHAPLGKSSAPLWDNGKSPNSVKSFNGFYKHQESVS